MFDDPFHRRDCFEGIEALHVFGYNETRKDVDGQKDGGVDGLQMGALSHSQMIHSYRFPRARGVGIEGDSDE